MNPKSKLINFLFLILLFVFVAKYLFSQPLTWRALPNSPVTNGYRFEDIFFVNPSVGWICDISGRLFKTTDGGSSWVLQVSASSNFPFRSLGFSDTLNGYAGLYYRSGSLITPLLKTTDGGANWVNVENIPSPVPAGICGISVVNSQIMYGVGKIDGPANVVKTTNGGGTWQSIDMTGIASRLVDCHFFTKDSGFVVGAIGPINSSRDIVLFTSNGGASWETNFISFPSAGYESCWKIDFSNRANAVISLNHVSDSLSILKSSDGGQSWIRNAFPIDGYYFTQGIGFLNENTGWIGGDAGYTFSTTDGGLTWSIYPVGENVNRYRFLNDTLAYSVGVRVYKFSRDTATGIILNSSTVPDLFFIGQNYPNPFNPSTSIKFELRKESKVRITVTDIMGREIKVLIDSYLSGGQYHTSWDGTDLNNNIAASGLYFCRIESDGLSSSRKMMLLR